MTYRELLKETYKLTQNNKPFRRFLIQSYKLSYPEFLQNGPKEQATLLKQFAFLLKKLSNLQKSSQIKPKQQLRFSYISHSFQKIDIQKDLNAEERKLFRVFSHVQFCFLCYSKKLFPKKNLGKKDFFHNYNNENGGRITCELEKQQISAVITVPIIGVKYNDKPLF